VLDNLISNAVKFTPPGGRVSVRTYRSDEVAVLEVSDTGMGMTAEDQAQLFQRFFRTASATDSAIQGTGLGLSIVQAIVEAHGGAVTVQSSVGRGTTFRVELPLAHERVAAA
jgi:signal transduction histidine kinase